MKDNVLPLVISSFNLGHFKTSLTQTSSELLIFLFTDLTSFIFLRIEVLETVFSGESLASVTFCEQLSPLCSVSLVLRSLNLLHFPFIFCSQAL